MVGGAVSQVFDRPRCMYSSSYLSLAEPSRCQCIGALDSKIALALDRSHSASSRLDSALGAHARLRCPHPSRRYYRCRPSCSTRSSKSCNARARGIGSSCCRCAQPVESWTPGCLIAFSRRVYYERVSALTSQRLHVRSVAWLEAHLEPTLAVLARVGAHVRVLTITALGDGTDGGRERLSSSALLSVIARCPALEGIAVSASVWIATAPHHVDGHRLRALYIDYTEHAVKRAAPCRPSLVMAAAIAAKSLPNLRAVGLQSFAAPATAAWALFRALSYTAIDTIHLARCWITNVDTDVEAYAVDYGGSSKLDLLASTASDGMARMVQAAFACDGISLTSGYSGVAAIVQPKPRAARIAEAATMLIIDHYSTLLVDELAGSRRLKELFVVLRQSEADFALLERLSRRLSAEPTAFSALKMACVTRDARHDAVPTMTDESLDEDAVQRLDREAAALEAKIWAEIERRADLSTRRWRARPTRRQMEKSIRCLVQPGINADVRSLAR